MKFHPPPRDFMKSIWHSRPLRRVKTRNALSTTLSRPRAADSLSELGSLQWQRGRLMWSVTLAWISRQAMFIGRAMLRSSLLVE